MFTVTMGWVHGVAMDRDPLLNTLWWVRVPSYEPSGNVRLLFTNDKIMSEDEHARHLLLK